MKKLHLFCNAHIDVIWQWTMEEAISTTLSTFRVAAELCEQHENFIFNHNEALLYQWVEEYDPGLFERIQKLVAEGKWHIVGGWTLQPDCLMPTGESIVRHMLYGQSYFKEKFGVEIETALNFDSFGHAQGMVQIMEQAGYKNYIFMRPEDFRMDLPQMFEWRGYDDDSKIVAYRLNSAYSSLMGQAAKSVQEYLDDHPDDNIMMKTWGIGNHGGGPSRQDVEDLNIMIRDYEGKVEILHSHPDAFFQDCAEKGEKLPVISEDLIPSWVGCYSTLVPIKQLHRKLESKLISAEKISVLAKEKAGLTYPSEEIAEAFRILAIMQFHDVLPGSCSRLAEEESVRIGNYGLEIAERIHTRAMFALTAKEKAAKNGGIPLFVWNPHPYEIDDMVQCEFMLADQNWEDTLTMVHAYVDGEEVPCQNIKEGSNFNLDWRKRVVVHTKFKPMSITRIDLETYTTEKPEFSLGDGSSYLFDNGEMQVRINRMTGLVDSYRVQGKELVQKGAFCLEVFHDTADPWRLDTVRIDQKKGEFTLLDSKEAARVAGVSDPNFESVRMIEDGDVFVRVEALFGYENSRACVIYTLPKKGTAFEIDLTSFFGEKDSCLRMAIPTNMEAPILRGQSMFGDKPLYKDGRESESQRWMSAEEDGIGLIFINQGNYGSCNNGNIMRQTVLRSAAYSGHPLPGRTFMEYNRYLPRAEQGERNFHFRVVGACSQDLITTAEHHASLENERMLAFNIFPGGEGQTLDSGLVLSDSRIRVSAFKKAEDGDGYILRVFNPESESIKTKVQMPQFDVCEEIELKHHKVQTYRINHNGMNVCHLLD